MPQPIVADKLPPAKRQIKELKNNPLVEQTEVRSLFQVQHRGAFKEDETLFGYANVAEYTAVLPVMDRKASDIESIDLVRCEQKTAKCNALPTSTIPFHHELQPCQHQFAPKLATSERYWPKQEKRQTSTAPKKVKEVLPAQKFRQQLSSRNPVVAERPTVAVIHLGNSNGVSCTSNTAVQLFRHLPHFVAALRGAPPSDVRDALLAVITGHHTDTTFLRQTVGAGFEEEQMHDASEFFLHIVNKLTSLTICEWFAFEQMSLQTCMQCPNNQLRAAQQTQELLLNLHPQPNRRQSFHQLLERVQQAEPRGMLYSLSGASQVQHAHISRLGFNIRDAQKYLLVHLHKFHKVEFVKQEGDNTNLNANNQVIFGSHFRAIGAIEHSGTSCTNAHHITWCRIGDDWVRFNDDKPPEYQAKLPACLRDIVGLVFEIV
uniref:USP domain-containing protein n=1 Tax=Plectus sambesii TaxID=2011161 RepID=A0A914WWX0_9BILA